MNRILINGVGLEVQHWPAAPDHIDRAPIVFLHEGLGSVAMWRDWPQRVCAATGRAGVVYSRRGYGQSDAIADVRGSGRLQPDYMHQEAWEVLPALLQGLDLKTPVLLGHSDGATIALLHASRHPLSACIVMAPHVMVEDISIRSIEQARLAYETGGLRERLARYHANVDCAFWQWNDIWLDPRFRGFDIRPDGERITAPVLAIQGRDDAYGSMQQLHDIRPKAAPITRHELPNCGHSPHRDQADQTTELITRFLSDLP